MGAPPLPEVEKAEADLDAAADQKFAETLAAMRDDAEPAKAEPAEGTTTEAPKETPDEQPAAPPQEAKPEPAPSEEAPEQSAEPPSEPARVAIDLDKLSPDDRRAWEDILRKYNGDVAKVGAAYWDMNRRLGKHGDAAEPEAKSAPPPPANAAEVVESTVAARVKDDPVMTRMVGEYQRLSARAEAIEKANPNLDIQIAYVERRMQEDDAKTDPLLEQKLMREMDGLVRARAELDRIGLTVSTMELQYQNRLRTIRDATTREVHERLSSEETARREREAIEAYASEVEASWPAHVAAAAKANGIDTSTPEGRSVYDAFAERAKFTVLQLAELDQAPTVAEMPRLLDRLAKEQLSHVEAAHRYQSRLHAAKVQHAAAAPAPVVAAAPPPASSPQTQTPRREQTPADVDAEYDLRRHQRLKDLSLS